MLTTLVRLGKRLRQPLPDEEIDFHSYVLLKTVAHLGSTRLSTIASVLDLDASTVSRHVKSLEDRGLLGRTTDPDDGRASQVAVTPHGQTCIEAGGKRRLELIGSLVADWADQDREDLRRLLNRLSLALENQDHTR